MLAVLHPGNKALSDFLQVPVHNVRSLQHAVSRCITREEAVQLCKTEGKTEVQFLNAKNLLPDRIDRNSKRTFNIECSIFACMFSYGKKLSPFW